MKSKTTQDESILPKIELGRKNLMFFLLGIIALIIGFILMSIGPWDNPLSLTLSPIILLIAYLILFPIAIILKRKKTQSEKASQS